MTAARIGPRRYRDDDVGGEESLKDHATSGN
jgi:hypothetical protein